MRVASPGMNEPRWLMTGFGFEMHSRERVMQLIHRRDRDLSEGILYDEALRDRYRRSGIDAVMLTLAIRDPGAELGRMIRRPMRPSRWGEDEFERGQFVEAWAHDPGTTGPEFDQWLADQIRAVLEGWPKLAQ